VFNVNDAGAGGGFGADLSLPQAISNKGKSMVKTDIRFADLFKFIPATIITIANFSKKAAVRVLQTDSLN
jgi:hypothetical protein